MITAGTSDSQRFVSVDKTTCEICLVHFPLDQNRPIFAVLPALY